MTRPQHESVAAQAGALDLGELERLRHVHLGRLLIRAFEMFEADVLEGFRARGIGELERSDLPVLRNLDLEGNRISEIAERAGLSKQTIGPLVRELEAKGIVWVSPDPGDGRAKVVRFTEKGLRGLQMAVEVIRETTERYTRHLGKEGMEGLRSALLSLLEEFERRPGSNRSGRGAGAEGGSGAPGRDGRGAPAWEGARGAPDGTRGGRGGT